MSQNKAEMIPLVIGIGLFLMALERIIPDQKLPVVRGWWLRVIIVNSIQLAVVLIGARTWEVLFQKWSIFQFSQVFSAPMGGLISYFLIVFVFYWWHRARHDLNFLWNICHQLHHSPQRIETITSFYKHPLEIILDGIIISLINFTLLGLTIEGAGYVTLYTAAAEFFYHMNIKTPRWIGYIIQRPEMHRIHHQRGKHYKNFADLPILDLVFGTFENPETYQGLCGFKPEREEKLGAMLLFKNVNNSIPKK